MKFNRQYQMEGLTQVVDSGCSSHRGDAKSQSCPGLGVGVVGVSVLVVAAGILHDPLEPTECAAVEECSLPVRIPDPCQDRMLIIVEQRHTDLFHEPERIKITSLKKS